MYPKWVQVMGQSGTTAWSQEEEDKYYASFKIGEVTETKNIIPEAKKPGRPRKAK